MTHISMRIRLLLVVLFALPGFAAFAQVETATVTALRSAIEGREAAESQLAEELAALQMTIEQSQGDQAAFEAALISRVTAIIRSDTGTDDLADDVAELQAAVTAYEFPQTHVERLASGLQSALNGEDAEYSDAARAQLSELADEIYAVEAAHSFSAVLAMTARLNDAFPSTGIPAAEMRQLMTTDNVTEMAALVERLDGILGQNVTTGIHVVSARFGRISGGGAANQCDVLSTLRNQCQGERNCTIAEPQLLGLCGGSADFAPLAYGSNRGIAVRYACLTEHNNTWSAILADPSLLAATGALIQSTIIRTAADEITCAL